MPAKRKIIRWSILLLLAGLFPVFSGAADKNSCLVCHTNEGILKSLYRPPEIKGGEGEG